MILSDSTPADYDLPSKFADWRPIQREAIEQAIYGDRRFQVLCLPTGTGKTLLPMSIAQIMGCRTVILTSTLGLMNQYISEFGVDPRAAGVLARVTGRPISSASDLLVDIRGKSNYRCMDHHHVTCEDGPRIGCRYQGSSKCCYDHALSVARNSQRVVTNYKYWLHLNKSSRGAGLQRTLKPNPVELLVLDEAHLADKELSDFLAIKLYEREVMELLHTSLPNNELLKDWKQFAKDWKDTAKEEWEARGKILSSKGSKSTKAELEIHRRMEILHDKLDRLSSIQPDSWVCEKKEGGRLGRVWEFDPIWPGMFAERYLFCGVPRVLLMSATVRPKTLQLLGVKKDEFEFKEWKRIFPANRCPVYHLPTVRLNWRTKEDGYKKWVDRIDEIIESRFDRKGIIHTVSYDRQDYLYRHSRFSQYFIGNTNDPDTPKAQEIVHQFKEADAPAILVSPSFSTGWDFPMCECEWQIIGKIPFPPSQSKVMKARMERDPQYLNYVAMQTLVQACGRGMRSERDRCESFIIDDSITWFYYQNRSLAPSWFNVRKMAQLPPPPKSLFAET